MGGQRAGSRFLVLQFTLSGIFSSHAGWAQPGDVVPAPRPNTQAARSAGQLDGGPDGQREGRERGTAEGRQQGLAEGYRSGFNRCESERRRWNYDEGYREGYRIGEREGRREGDDQGERNGRRDGDQQGTTEGQRLADQYAHRDAQGPGTDRGESEANQSDAQERGEREGAIEGERQARARAREVDYVRGREEYRAERFAAPVDHQDAFSQIEDPSEESASLSALHTRAQVMSLSPAAPGPDFRYSNPRRTFSTNEETQAYQGGYREGYVSGFRATYDAAHGEAYRPAREGGDREGCQDALRRDYSSDRRRGIREGNEAGYRRAYDLAYQRAYRDGYDRVYSGARDQAYQATYPAAYERHFEDARNSAFRRRYQALYDLGFENARRDRFNETYPGFAAEELANGRRDEEERFRAEPLALTGAEAIETIRNGLFEPGETLRLKLFVRNFAPEDLGASDIRVSLRALDAQAAVISQGDAFFRRGVRGNSLTQVTDALEFRMNESAAGRVSAFEISVAYRGQVISTRSVRVDTKFLLATEFAESPVFQEGIETRVRLKVSNSSAIIVEGARISFLSRPETLEILDPEAEVPRLGPGESTTMQFRVIARARSGVFPFVFSVTLPSGRRVGLLDQAREVPVLNDYRLSIRNDVASLRRPGITRLQYTLKNVNSRLYLRGLQVHVRLKDANDHLMSEGISVIGPNPQLVIPLRRDQEHTFVVPFFVQTPNGGGRVEFEVKEEGHTVVVHQREF